MDIPNLGFPLEEEESAVKKRCLETTGVHVTEGEQEGTAHVTEGEQEGAAHVTEGEQEGTAHVTEGEQEGTAHVTEGEQEGTARVTEGEQEDTVHVTEGEQEGTAHVTEGEREGVTDAVTMADGCVAKVKRTSAYKRRKLVRPTLSSCAMYTAQPRKNIPGHTGYLTFATLHTKQKRSGTTSEPKALACTC